MRSALKEQKDEVNARFTQIDARFPAIDARFTQIDARFTEMNGHLLALHRLLLRISIGGAVAVGVALIGMFATSQ